jgi:hypothetical protein
MKVCERVVNALEVGDRSKVKNMETNGTPGSHTAQRGPLSCASDKVKTLTMRICERVVGDKWDTWESHSADRASVACLDKRGCFKGYSWNSKSITTCVCECACVRVCACVDL